MKDKHSSLVHQEGEVGLVIPFKTKTKTKTKRELINGKNNSNRRITTNRDLAFSSSTSHCVFFFSSPISTNQHFFLSLSPCLSLDIFLHCPAERERDEPFTEALFVVLHVSFRLTKEEEEWEFSKGKNQRCLTLTNRRRRSWPLSPKWNKDRSLTPCHPRITTYSNSTEKQSRISKEESTKQ